MTCHGVIFDLDGTLLDTIGDLADSMNAVLENHGLPLHRTEEYKLFVGEGVETLVARSLPAGLEFSSDMPGLVAEMKSEYRNRWSVKTKPYTGVPELLRGLAERNLPIAVLSNKPDEFTKEMIGHYFSGVPFVAVMGAQKGFPMKPDPSTALMVCRHMGLEPETVVYLGDSGTDMQTALRAGMIAVGALWGFRGEKELRANGAKILLDKPMELMKLCLASASGHPS